MRLRTKFTIAAIAMITIIVALTGALFTSILQSTLHEQLGNNVLNVARTVARIPALKDAMSAPNPSATIQPLVEAIRMSTGASFIVVGNSDGIRYSHPVPERIGQPMVGGDNGPALNEGKDYVSVAIGTLGPSIRGKVPIVDVDGEVIGVVSVGFIFPEANRVLMSHLPTLLFVLLAAFGIGLVGAGVLAHSIKKATHGLEPAEIGALAEHRNAILGAIREAIIAIDVDGKVVVANATVREMLPGLEVGMPILAVLPNSRLPEVLQSGEPEFDQRMLIGDITVVTNRIPVFIDGKAAGVVASFRDQSELDRLARELSDVRRYTEALRAQAHDFANTLQAVSGMLQLSQVDDAVDFIQEVTEHQRELVEALPRSIGDHAVAALLLGKWARAEELHCLFQVDPTSRMEGRLPESSLLVRIIGNLIDNALEAVQASPVGQRQVRVRISEQDDGLIIEIGDSGPGVPAADRSRVFNEGFSTKGEGRGVGLTLVKRLVERSGGALTIRTAPEGGALFQVLLPRPGEV